MEEEGEAVRMAREELVDCGKAARAGESAGDETQGTLLPWLRAGAAAQGAHGRLLGVAAATRLRRSPRGDAGSRSPRLTHCRKLALGRAKWSPSPGTCTSFTSIPG